MTIPQQFHAEQLRGSRFRVKAQALNVREGAGTNYKDIGDLQRDDIVEAIEANPDGTWLRVRRERDDLTGWCSAAFLERIDTPPSLPANSGFELPPIRYDVPEPTSYTGAHVIRLELPVNYFSKQLAPDFALEFSDSRFSNISLELEEEIFKDGLTMEFWIKRIENTAANLAPGLRIDGQGRFAYIWGPMDSPDRVEIKSEPLKLGTWHHIALTKQTSSNEVSVYLDGNKVGTKLSPGLPVPGKFGGAEGGRWLNGQVDEFRLWNVVRTEDEIRDNMSAKVYGQTGLVCYWRFNEGQGDTITDYSGNGHDGKAFGTRWVVSDRPLGQAAPELDLSPEKLKDVYSQAQKGIFDADYFPNLDWIQNDIERKAATKALPPDKDVFIKNYSSGLVMTFYRTVSGLAHRFVDPHRGGEQPAIYLIERYRLSSYLGNYGAGRTVGTYSLLPGEKTTISISSYRYTEETRKESASILDSYSQETADEYADSLMKESAAGSSNKASSSFQRDQSVNVAVGGSVETSFGFASAELHTDMEVGEKKSKSRATESSREEFAKNVSNTTSRHAAAKSAKRDVSITASNERTSRFEDTQQVVREIQNTNSSRTLNFIFRQMNQEFYTILHLIDVRVAASGLPPVTLHELDKLLEASLEEDYRADVRKFIESELSEICDYKGDTHPGFLKKFELAKAAGAPSEKYLAINRDFTTTYTDHNAVKTFEVPGIITNVAKITMRTDGVMVEAVLGQGVALDEYALRLQNAEAESKELDNRIKAQKLRILEEGDEVGAALYSQMFSNGDQG